MYEVLKGISIAMFKVGDKTDPAFFIAEHCLSISH